MGILAIFGETLFDCEYGRGWHEVKIQLLKIFMKKKIKKQI